MRHLLLIAALAASSAAAADRYHDNVTYQSTTDGKGNVHTCGSDGSRSRTSQNATNDDWTTTTEAPE